MTGAEARVQTVLGPGQLMWRARRLTLRSDKRAQEASHAGEAG
jgi:hypothetical protein